MAMMDVIRADEMSRLGVCADDDCKGIVLDLSRNRSKLFCGTTCGNRAAVAAYPRPPALTDVRLLAFLRSASDAAAWVDAGEEDHDYGLQGLASATRSPGPVTITVPTAPAGSAGPRDPPRRRPSCPGPDGTGQLRLRRGRPADGAAQLGGPLRRRARRHGLRRHAADRGRAADRPRPGRNVRGSTTPCPDNVDQGVGSLEDYVPLVMGGEWYFWWDCQSPRKCLTTPANAAGCSLCTQCPEPLIVTLRTRGKSAAIASACSSPDVPPPGRHAPTRPGRRTRQARQPFGRPARDHIEAVADDLEVGLPVPAGPSWEARRRFCSRKPRTTGSGTASVSGRRRQRAR